MIKLDKSPISATTVIPVPAASMYFLCLIYLKIK